MKILLITDAWKPQTNSVVTTLVELVRELQTQGHEVVVVHPGQFRTWTCPGLVGLGLALAGRHGLDWDARRDGLARHLALASRTGFGGG